MKIDLNKVIGYSKDCLQSRALMRSIILDLYPGETRDMNVLLDVYESGIPREIRNQGSITDAQYCAYIQKIESLYGLQEVYIIDGLNAWIDVCLGAGASKNLHRPTGNSHNSTNNPVSLGKPIEHAPIIAQSVKDVSGSSADFSTSPFSSGSNTITIVKFRGFDEKELVVPSSIDGKRVVCIGKEAYKDCLTVEKVTIAEGIEFIEDQAFAGCSNLKQVILPSTLKRIGSEKRDNSYSSLSFMGLGAGYGAFANTAIKSIILPSQLTSIGEGCFSSCERLESINLPNGIKTIESKAFSGCKSLRNIQLPDNLEEIHESAFFGCAFSKIEMPMSVKAIKNRAFSYCKQLTNIRLNEGLQSIGDGAFQDCENLAKITLPSTVKTFGRDIFNITGWYQPSDRRRNGYSTSRKNEKLVIYCYAGSAAIEYARKEGYQIENAAKQNA